jgi:hypothetical protein
MRGRNNTAHLLDRQEFPLEFPESPATIESWEGFCRCRKIGSDVGSVAPFFLLLMNENRVMINKMVTQHCEPKK